MHVGGLPRTLLLQLQTKPNFCILPFSCMMLCGCFFSTPPPPACVTDCRTLLLDAIYNLSHLCQEGRWYIHPTF